MRARVEHTLAGLKTWKILRDYRRAAALPRLAGDGVVFLTQRFA